MATNVAREVSLLRRDKLRESERIATLRFFFLGYSSNILSSSFV
jgi:hypothetical protein